MSMPVSIDHRCPLCMTTSSAVGIIKGAKVLQCPCCGFSFFESKARPRTVVYEDWYMTLKDCSQEKINTFLTEMEEAYTKQLSILEAMSEGRSLLDVGCGIGIFLVFARLRHWNIQGVDLSEPAKNLAKKFFDISYASSLENIVPDSFDVIRLAHVLEHTSEPKQFLKTLIPLLKKNGILSIILPNCEPLCPFIINRFRRLRHKDKFIGGMDPEDHIVGFSTKALQILASSLDLKPIKLFTISRGNSTYFPMFYDGLLRNKSMASLLVKSSGRYLFSQIISNLGNKYNRGEFIVGYFSKA